MKKLVTKQKNTEQRKTEKNGKRGGTLVRIAACICCAALIVVLCVVVLPNKGSAENATSLPHIEEIVASKSTYNILEIVPKTATGGVGTGSLGYYTKGQEPYQTWETAFSGANAPLGKTGRQTYAGNLLTNLVSSGLLSTGTTTPLTFSGNDTIAYTEDYYWEIAGSAGTADLTGWTALKLAQAENVTVKGNFTETAAKNGFYDGVYNYILSTGGGYVQKIDKFIIPAAGDANIGSYYYYQPTFTAVTTDNFESLYGQALYTLDAASGLYTYFTTLSSSSSLDTSVTYYYASATGAPKAASDFYSNNTYTIPAGWYAAVANTDTPFEAAASGGYFKREVTSYAFVPGGTGSFTFVPSDTGADHQISTDTVYYKGMISNNNWFLQDVFDRADTAASTLSVKVTSVTPSELTSDMINSADLISLSGGFTLGGTDPTLIGAYANNDISAELAYDIYYRALHESCPLIVDYSLTRLDSTLMIARLSQMCLMAYDANVTNTNFSTYAYTWSALSTTNFVSKNVYCFEDPFAYSDSGTAQSLATASFDTPFSDSVVTAGFSDVLSEIRNENFLRKVDNPGTTDMLKENVTIANAIRYIINYAGQRAVTTKDSIKVLDIEPGNATTTALSKATVLSWLGSDTSYTESSIDITTMSTAEFIGKIEDINETYDMVYLGTSLDGFNTQTVSGSTITNYNDNSMDGLVYSSIGDSYKASKYLGGLLQQDYWNGDTSTIDFTSSTNATTYRFSGNDITAEKVTELTNFAQGGYPVVIANDVFNGSVSDTTSAFSVSVTASVSGKNVTLSASATDTESGIAMNATYKWYKVGSNTAVSSSATYTFAPGTGANATYYCVATASSNGVSTARSNNILVTNTTSVTATVDTDSGRENGSYGGGNYSYYAHISAQTSASGTYLTASAVDGYNNAITGQTASYKWYKWDNDDYYEIPQATSATLFVPEGDYGYYYCGVSLSSGTGTAYTDTVYVYSDGSSPYEYDNDITGHYNVSTVNYYVDITTSVNGNNVTLTAVPKNSVDNSTLTGNFRYYWYRNNGRNAVGYSASYTGTPTNKYYCVVYPPSGNDYATTYNVTVASGSAITATVQSGATAGSYKKMLYSTTGGINTARVDSTSEVYQAISAIKDRDNVMSVQELNASTLQKYLNLSKPQINLTSSPTEYVNNNGTMTSITASADGNYYLNYTFTIENNTDPTPATTTYDCALYLDLNADGKYSDAEELSDIVVTQNGQTVFPSLDSDGNQYYRLTAGVSYNVSRQVPSGYAGILPWKLEVYKNGAPRIHASVHQYTRVAPTADQVQTIRVLQIASDANGVLNLQDQQVASNTGYDDLYSTVTGKYYAGIYGKLLADVTDFDVKVTTIKATALEKKFSNVDASQRRAAIYNYLNGYNMVIVGFDDMYKEIGQYTAYAITDYIAGGKSILFTHDTTSLSNIDKNTCWYEEDTVQYDGYTYDTQNNLSLPGDPAYWGYNFNTIIRDSVGLDRYGITSLNQIKTTDTSDTLSTIKSILFPQTSSTTLNTTEISSLVSKGYSIAYQANSNADGSAAETLAQTQGYTNYSLIRYGSTASTNLKYRNSTYGSGRETTTVSQVNEGQITTYPNNINTAAFEGTGTANTMSVGKTHEQYYQLNMNSDDIVVWYCLASGNTSANAYYNDLPNDAVNAYYIYNKGNVTYSGVGHTSGNSNYTGGSVSDAIKNEAKLFVNTMIASYQSGKQDPEVKITTDVSGSTALNYKYFYADYTSDSQSIIENSTAGNSSQRAVYFRLTDTNLDADKVISLAFTYNSGGEDVTFSPTVYLANGTATTTFSGGKVYCIYLPDEVLSALNGDNVNSVTVTIHVTTTIDGVARTGEDSLELRKVDLFQLQ